MSAETTPRDGRLVDSGDFTIDERRAREKLQNYRLPGPHHYLLEFVKAAHLLSATRFDVEADGQSVEVEFDGRSVPVDALEQLHTAAFGADDTANQQALRHLAIGVNAAQGYGHKGLAIETGGARSGRVAFRDDEIRVESRSVSGPRMRIELDRRVQRRVLFRFLKGLFGDPKELELLRARTPYSEMRIRVNGQRLHSGMVLDGDYLEIAEFEENRRGSIGLKAGSGIRVTDFVRRGVVVDERRDVSPFAPFGFHAVVDDPELRTDLSQSGIVEDEAFEELKGCIEELCYHLLARHLSGLDGIDARRSCTALKNLVIPLLADRSRFDIEPRCYDEFVEAVSGLPIFDRAADGPSAGSGRLVSIRDASITEGGETRLFYTTRRFDIAPEESPVSTAISLDDRALRDAAMTEQRRETFIGHFADEGADVTERFERRLEAENNRRQWNQRSSFELEVPVLVETPRNGYILQLGEVDERRSSTVYFVKQGRLLDYRSVELEPGPYHIAIRGDLPTDESFTGPDFGADQLQPVFAGVLELVLARMRTGDFDLATFCGLLGDLQERINRVFKWEWSDWPSSLVDSPFGIAPPLVATEEPRDQTTETRVQLDRLDVLADEPILESSDGRTFSLRELYGQIQESEPPGVVTEQDGDLVVTSRSGDGGAELRFEVGRDVARLVAEFYREPDSEERASGTGRADRESDDGDELAAEAMQLASTLLHEEGSREATEVDPREAQRPRSQSYEPVDDARREAKGPGDSGSVQQPVDRKQTCRQLLDDLRRWAPPGAPERIGALTDVTVIERGGSRPVRVVGDGNRLVFDGNHPTVAHAFESPDDPVARAFAAGVAFAGLVRYDDDHGCGDWSRRRTVRVRRRFVASAIEQLG